MPWEFMVGKKKLAPAQAESAPDGVSDTAEITDLVKNWVGFEHDLAEALAATAISGGAPAGAARYQDCPKKAKKLWLGAALAPVETVHFVRWVRNRRL